MAEIWNAVQALAFWGLLLGGLAWPPSRLALGLLGVWMGLLAPPDYGFVAVSAGVAAWGGWVWLQQAGEPARRRRWNAREREIIAHLPSGDYPIAIHMDNGEYIIHGRTGWQAVPGSARTTRYGGLTEEFVDKDFRGVIYARVRAEHHPYDGQTPNMRRGSRLRWLMYQAPEGEHFQQYQTRRDV